MYRVKNYIIGSKKKTKREREKKGNEFTLAIDRYYIFKAAWNEKSVFQFLHDITFVYFISS